MRAATKLSAAAETEIDDVLLVRKQEIPIRKTWIDQKKLKFYPENPRVHSVMRADHREPSQQDIQAHLLELDHVKALIQSIKANGGLIDPVIVRDGSFEVLEGNSRLAAYRALAENDPIKWAKIQCLLLPKDVSESIVFSLLGEYHIKGKRDWAPFEQAGFLYRRFTNHNVDAKSLATEIGLSQRHVNHLIETYRFMRTHKQEDISRWSYFDEYLKSRKIAKAREQYPGLDKLILHKIDTGEIAKAVEIRDQLPVICASSKVLKKFCEGSYNFENAFDRAVVAGGSNSLYKKLEKFRQWLAQNDTQDEILESEGQTRAKLVYEIDKIATLVKRLGGRLH